MKKLLLSALFILCCFSVYCQTADITKFLGFPVDGTKASMIQKLKTKGFTKTPGEDCLKGRFNGTDVHVFISTENNKVCRIMVCDANTCSETDIKIRFNTLCRQFASNEKYLVIDDFTIPDDEDISYEMNVKNKRYEAQFYQKADPATIKNVTEYLDTTNLEGTTEKHIKELKDIQKEEFEKLATITLRKTVWFMISEYYGEYYICMFYDNENNRAHGEDL